MSTYLSFFVLGSKAREPFDEVTLANLINEKSEDKFKSQSLDAVRHVAYLSFDKLKTSVLEVHGYHVDREPGVIFVIRTINLSPAAEVELNLALNEMEIENLIEQKYLH